MVNESIITLLATEVVGFSLGDYLLSKAADLGTGTLWAEIKKRFSSNTPSLEIQLYNAIESSINRYAENVGPDAVEKRANACELIYGKWLADGHLDSNDVITALGSINGRIIGAQNLDYWYRLFYEELIKDENTDLYKWYVSVTQEDLFRFVRKHDEEISSKINRCLELLETRDRHSNSFLEAEKSTIQSMINQPILGEKVLLKDIYVSLHAITHFRNMLYEDTEKADVVDTTTYIWNWFAEQQESIIYLHGEPGVGKSSLLKMIAATMASELYTDLRIAFVELHRVHFSSKKEAIDSLKEYIKEKYSWFYDLEDNSRRLLIIDGLDEIKQNLYETSEELISGIENINSSFPVSVIISGRTNIMNRFINKIHGLEMELLPLYLDEYELSKWGSSDDANNLLKQDLRPLFWEKLSRAFMVHAEMPLHNERFDDISKSPLMMFLVMWTMKNTGKDFSNFRNPAELYDCIIQYIYTREYNRNEKKYIYYNKQEYNEYQQMLKHLGGCATRLSGKSVCIQDIFDYCVRFNQAELCERWIQKHRQSNPSKLVLLFFLREYQNKINWSISEIEFVHKTFCDYLGALSILDFLHTYAQKDEGEELLRAFYLLSYRPIETNTIKFIGEILENNRGVSDDSFPSFATYTADLEKIVVNTFNVDYPISTVKDTQHIFVSGYVDMVHKVQTYTDNIKALVELVTDEENGYNSDYVFDFSNADFSDVSFQRWIFNKSDMEDVRFLSAQLSGSYFKECQLQGSSFMSSFADCAYFCDSDLSEADFTSCSLSCADFTGANCTDTDFTFATLCGSYFCDGTLVRTNFSSADLIASNFDNTSMTEVDFSDADLSRADLSGATFINCIWDNCILEGAKLKGVKIKAFDLYDENILEMLCEADLFEADWEGVELSIKERLLTRTES